MKAVLFIFLIITSSLSASATAQAGDILIWNGDTLTLFSNPLELRKDIRQLRTKLFGDQKAGINTGCWRGYIAEWTIIKKELYLTNIFSCDYRKDHIKADLKQLFGDDCQNGKVRAGWVTGDLYIPKGKLVHYVHLGYKSIYEKEIVLTFDKGKLIDQKRYEYPNSHQSVYTKNTDSLQTFIYSHINWKIIPYLGKEKKIIVVTIQSGDSPKPEHIHIVNGKNNLFDQEALRVIKMLPDWDVNYKHGKVYHEVFSVPIVFDEVNREKYKKHPKH